MVDKISGYTVRNLPKGHTVSYSIHHNGIGNPNRLIAAESGFLRIYLRIKSNSGFLRHISQINGKFLPLGLCRRSCNYRQSFQGIFRISQPLWQIIGQHHFFHRQTRCVYFHRPLHFTGCIIVNGRFFGQNHRIDTDSAFCFGASCSRCVFSNQHIFR